MNDFARRYLRRFLRGFLRLHRRPVADLLHAVLAASALSAAFLLRFEFALAPPYSGMLAEALPLLLVAKLAVFRLFGMCDLAWRYLGFRDLIRLAASNLAASAAAAVLLRLDIGSAFPRSIHIIDLLACLALMAGAHAAAKSLCEFRAAAPGGEKPRQRVALYGAGKTGAMLASEIHSHPQSGCEVIAFFDDDPSKRGLRMHDIRVLGGLERLPAAVRKHRIDAVWLAMSAAGPERLTEILKQCRLAGIPAKRVPAPQEIGGSGMLVRHLRDIRLEDLLGRQPVELKSGVVRARLHGAAVLVTGAGGSIGSELCRHIARHQPAVLVGFDHSENALYEIDRELRARYPELPFRAEIGSIQNSARLEELFRRHEPRLVYHAAAYKHVPLMESQIFEAVENNVFGTRSLALAAAESGAHELVLISSDKAVRPANVMGATKRLAEMVVQSMNSSANSSSNSSSNPSAGRFLAVRFGNVLGSSGSVVPVFREQIARGGPVMVTHPEMRRFFMTTPEAAALVLEAAALGESRERNSESRKTSEIFALEMGEPVRVVDLARKMILLSGLEPGRDIGIEFTGIRPGEKLYEELSAGEENTLKTLHPQIRVFSAAAVPAAELAGSLRRLRAAVDQRDAWAVVECLKDLVPGYHPSSFLLHSLEETSEERPLKENARGVYA